MVEPDLSASSSSTGGTGSPCGACKFLRRKCVVDCIFAPYFNSEEGPSKFAEIHKVFGVNNVSKLLHNVLVDDLCDAVVTTAYEAQAKIKDPAYGCVANIFSLQQLIRDLGPSLSWMSVVTKVLTRDVTNMVSKHSSWSQGVYEIASGRVLFMGNPRIFSPIVRQKCRVLSPRRVWRNPSGYTRTAVEDPISIQIKKDVSQQKVMSFEIGGDGILRYEDRMIKSRHFLPVRTNYSRDDYAWLYIEQMFTYMGHQYPLYLIEARNSLSSFGGLFQRGLGTQVNLSTAFHPQNDGQAERTVHTLKDMLRGCAIDFKEEPIGILDRKVRKLRSKEIAMVKVMWRNQKAEEATWESENDMRERYLTLFKSMDDDIDGSEAQSRDPAKSWIRQIEVYRCFEIILKLVDFQKQQGNAVATIIIGEMPAKLMMGRFCHSVELIEIRVETLEGVHSDYGDTYENPNSMIMVHVHAYDRKTCALPVPK
ncbi:LOB domain-containing protein 31 [Capsicum annuum]|nr:LOB domain-containing protein 31 [Capsicum annuum]